MPDGKMSRSGTAVLSFILSLSFWMPLPNYFICAVSILLGFKALKDIRDGGGKRPGRLFALSGIVIGVVPYYFGLLFLLRSVLQISAAAFTYVFLFVPPAVLLLLFLVVKRYRLL